MHMADALLSPVIGGAMWLASGAAIAHPGHGALQIHWHLDDMLWAAIGGLALVGIVLLVRKVLKR